MSHYLRDVVRFINHMETHEMAVAVLILVAAGVFFLRGFGPRP